MIETQNLSMEIARPTNLSEKTMQKIFNMIMNKTVKTSQVGIKEDTEGEENTRKGGCLNCVGIFFFLVLFLNDKTNTESK